MARLSAGSALRIARGSCVGRWLSDCGADPDVGGGADESGAPAGDAEHGCRELVRDHLLEPGGVTLVGLGLLLENLRYPLVDLVGADGRSDSRPVRVGLTGVRKSGPMKL